MHKFYDELDASQKHLRDGSYVARDAALGRSSGRALARSTSRRSEFSFNVCVFLILESVKVLLNFVIFLYFYILIYLS